VIRVNDASLEQLIVNCSIDDDEANQTHSSV
jgi:hypothetical protein